MNWREIFPKTRNEWYIALGLITFIFSGVLAFVVYGAFLLIENLL